MKTILLMALTMAFGSASFAGTPRQILNCSKFSIGQSEQSLGFPYKPGRKGVHDEYIMISTPVKFQAPGGYELPIRSTADSEYLGQFMIDSGIQAHFRTTAGSAIPGAQVFDIVVLMDHSMLTPGTSETVRFVINGQTYQDSCTSTAYTERLLLR